MDGEFEWRWGVKTEKNMSGADKTIWGGVPASLVFDRSCPHDLIVSILMVCKTRLVFVFVFVLFFHDSFGKDNWLASASLADREPVMERERELCV